MAVAQWHITSQVPSCAFPKTSADKYWPYIQYYTGEKDEDYRKNGEGQNHWSGAKSLEWYSGHMVRDTMHGEGEYRWRYLGPDGSFGTYEGHFYNNHMHGYGSVSYGDGRVFRGIFHGNVRWGPGIESHACAKEDVGLWSGKQLIRMCWQPDGPSIAPDLMSSNIGREIVKPHRNILSSSVKTIGELNSALELLKHYGAHPLRAVQKCSRLYPVHCTELSSTLCDTSLFENEYYMGKVYTLEEDVEIPDDKEIKSDEDTPAPVGTFYVWNNNNTIKHMMRHCYKHEYQSKRFALDLTSILSGPRKQFKSAGQHEIDSRTLLMACYLGHTSQVTQLIVENNIHPDVADTQGNTALMYAVCGERADIVHFLIDAGANVNSFNDSCCTPLGIVLIKLTCVQKDIPPNAMLQALLPINFVPEVSSSDQIIYEWLIQRDSQTPAIGVSINSPSKTNRVLSSKKIKSLTSVKDQSGGKKKSEAAPIKIPEQTSDESFSEDKRQYINMHREYTIRTNDIYQITSTGQVPYIFEVNDMIREIEANEDHQKKVPDKNPKKAMSKVLKDATKPSKDIMWQSDKDDKSIDSIEQQKKDTLTKLMSVLIQLLSDGANPKLVTCPQPALFIAIVSGYSEAVKQLICHGADVNEVYPEILGYRPIDIAISQAFCYDNLEIISILLEFGANTQHRLMYNPVNEVTPETMGPTLLHAVLARKTENENEEEVRCQILQILLDYNCNPTLQYKGRSAIDISMSKSMDIFDIFIRNPKTDLNSVINDLNQSILVKMFYLPFFKTVNGTERLQRITDLLLHGANPLKQCRNGEEKHENIFVFAKKTLNDLEGNQTKTTSPTAGKQDQKNKKPEKLRKEDKISIKSMGKMTDDIGEYKQALELVTECARLMYIRWLQANLAKGLIDIVKKYKHRHWNMILREVKIKKTIGLWLTPQRCLDIWNILASNTRKSYTESHIILKHLVSIAQFCMIRTMNKVPLKNPVTAIERGTIEKCISSLLIDNKKSRSLDSEMMWKRCYVKPEIIPKHAKIFNVCFECALPIMEDKIVCISCKLVSFCSLECMQANVDRVNCHPCSNILKDKYFPNHSNSAEQYF